MIIYTVTCRIMRADLADAWLAWLTDGHLDAVMAGGASGAEVLKLDLGGESPYAAGFAVHYRFPNWDAYHAYERDHAPRLRAEGLARFPTELGLAYERSVGEVVADKPSRLE